MQSINSAKYFNSQPHEEADISRADWRKLQNYFNSQPHEEADNVYSVCSWHCPDHFNSQPHEEADFIPGISKHIISNFNSQPHEEADAVSAACWYTSSFQLAASRGGWRPNMLRLKPHNLFQLAASRGGWRFTRRDPISRIVFQLAASRGGWHWRGSDQSRREGISTRSLTRRLTLLALLRLDLFYISTRSLTRRLTIFLFPQEPKKEFQLAASRGGWPRVHI